MRVLVVGGGVAGLATACGLVEAGHDVRVVERAPSLRATGGAVTLWSNGIGVLDAFGVDLGGAGRNIDAFDAWRHDGRRVWHVDVAEIRRRLGYGALTIPRYLLIERLAAALPAGVVDFGRDVTSIESAGGKAHVRFADGSGADADVVVGADGYRSVVRRGLFGDEVAQAAPTGWATWQGMSPVDHPIVRGDVGVNVIGRDAVGGFLPAGEGLLQWWFELRQPASEPVSPVQMLQARFGRWCSPVPEILAQVRDAELFPHFRHVIAAVWGSSRSTLVGDAAHVMPPSMAQGANQSLEDAWVLAACLSDDDVTAGLRRYERLRRRRVAFVSMIATLATTQQERPWNRVGRVPSRLATSVWCTGLRYTSTFLSSPRTKRLSPGGGVRRAR